MKMSNKVLLGCVALPGLATGFVASTVKPRTLLHNSTPAGARLLEAGVMSGHTPFTRVPKLNRPATERTWRVLPDESSSGLRLATLAAWVIFSFVAYIQGSQLLNFIFTNYLHIVRSGATNAFGPFVTLLGLVYSVVLGQVYQYYFDRQGQIQDSLYQESASLRTLFETATLLSDRADTDLGARDKRAMLAILDDVARDTLSTAFSARLSDEPVCVSDASLIGLLGTLESGAQRTAPSTVRLAADAIDRLIAARALRRSAVAGELPPVQTVTQRVVAAVLQLGFVLVDLGSPTLEAILFATISGCFFLIGSFLDDLANPFGGSWSVGPARDDLEKVAQAIDGALVAGAGLDDGRRD